MRNPFYTEPIESERKFRQLEKLGREVGVPVPQTFLEIEVKMPNGSILHHHKQRSHSWNRNAYNQLFTNMAWVGCSGATFEAGNLNFKRTAGTLFSDVRFPINNGADQINVQGKGFYAAAGDATYGIQFGSGVNAESFEDFILQTLITNGVGAGQLSYSIMTYPAPSYDAGTKTLTVSWIRYGNNNSVGDVTVNEIGITATGYSGGGVGIGLMSRDHIAVPVVIPATGQLKVTYAISLVYPA